MSEVITFKEQFKETNNTFD